MRRAAIAAEASIVQTAFHNFTPHGVSGVVVVQESHLSIHTWPEYGYAAVDFYTCGDCLPDAAHRVIYEGLRADHFELIEVQRGHLGPGRSMNMVRHEPGGNDQEAPGHVRLA